MRRGARQHRTACALATLLAVALALPAHAVAQGGAAGGSEDRTGLIAGLLALAIVSGAALWMLHRRDRTVTPADSKPSLVADRLRTYQGPAPDRRPVSAPSPVPEERPQRRPMRRAGPGPERGSAIGARPAVSVVAPPDRNRAWRAEIGWRHAGGTSRFGLVAVAEDDEQVTATVAVSEPVQWPPSTPDAGDALSAAVQSLERRLLDAGWLPRGNGDAWYARRFVWEPVGARTGTDVPADAGRGRRTPRRRGGARSAGGPDGRRRASRPRSSRPAASAGRGPSRIRPTSSGCSAPTRIRSARSTPPPSARSSKRCARRAGSRSAAAGSGTRCGSCGAARARHRRPCRSPAPSRGSLRRVFGLVGPLRRAPAPAPRPTPGA